MKNYSIIRKCYSKSERGVALFFALGILAVILITVMVFASRAITDRKVAAAYASSTEAQNIAESAMGRALLSLSRNTARLNECYTVRYTNKTNPPNISNDFDWLWKIHTPDYKLYNETDGSSKIQSENLRWQYIHQDIPNGENNSPLLGRFAYRIKGENLLNLNALCYHPLCVGNCNAAEGSKCTHHLGQSVAELDFNTTMTPVSFTKSALNGKIDTGTPSKPFLFDGMDFLFAAFGITNNGSSNIQDYFIVSAGDYMKEPDAWFNGDTNNNNIKDKSEYLHRFNLKRDWGTNHTSTQALLTQILNGNTSFYDANGNPTDNNSGISWFKNWTDTEGNWPNAETKSKQIVANLINYNAPETTPVVSDKDPSTWSGTNVPTYTGNKRTDYLNEVLVKISVTPLQGNKKTHTQWLGEEPWYSWDNPEMKIDLELLAETVNMYNLISSNYDVKFYGTIDIKYKTFKYETLLNVFVGNSSQSKTTTIDLNNCGSSFSYDSDIKPSKNYHRFMFCTDKEAGYSSFSIRIGQYGSYNDEPDLKGFFQIESIKIKNLKVILKKKNNGENVDYSILEDDTAEQISGAKSFDSSDTVLTNISYEINDPRHNLHKADWVRSSLPGPATNFAGTFGQPNSRVNCQYSYSDSSNNQDSELVNDPAWLDVAKDAHISTAYIRHGPMQSLWELGAIHRAAPWQTLNFKKPSTVVTSDSLTTNVASSGGGTYNAGDFRLYDQVTFLKGLTAADAVDNFGRINVNAVPSEVREFSFDALFRNMPFHNNGHYDPALETSKTNLLNIPLTDAVTYLRAAPNSRILYRRSDLFQTDAGSVFWNFFSPVTTFGAGTLSTDALQEQMIGRVINLMKANTNYDSAKVVVLAQSLKDVGGVTMAVDWDETGKIDGSATSAQAKRNAGYRMFSPDMDVSCFGTIPTLNRAPIIAKYGTYDNGVDKITGTAKMSAYWIYDNTQQKWKLVRVKHEE